MHLPPATGGLAPIPAVSELPALARPNPALSPRRPARHAAARLARQPMLPTRLARMWRDLLAMHLPPATGGVAPIPAVSELPALARPNPALTPRRRARHAAARLARQPMLPTRLARMWRDLLAMHLLPATGGVAPNPAVSELSPTARPNPALTPRRPARHAASRLARRHALRYPLTTVRWLTWMRTNLSMMLRSRPAAPCRPS